MRGRIHRYLMAAAIGPLVSTGCLAQTAATRSFGWRGDGSGVFPNADPPAEWSTDTGTNILWQATVGKGISSPVIAGDRVLVSAEMDMLVCVDRKTGKILWSKDNGFPSLPAEMKVEEKRQPADPGCGFSAATPVTDGKLVYMVYATGIVVCYDLEGNRQWVRYIDQQQTTEHGRSASPLLVKGKLLVMLSDLTALDAATGKTLWECADAAASYGTPTAAVIGDVDVVITPMGQCVRVSDGKIVGAAFAGSSYSSPIVGPGFVYSTDPAVAMKLPDKSADVIKAVQLWEAEEPGGSFYSSPLVFEDVVYSVNNEGVLFAVSAKTGKTVYKKEIPIPSAGGMQAMRPANIYASLAVAGKKLIICNDAGNALVVMTGSEYKEVAKNTLEEGSGACPVADGKLLFLRGGEKLYCIGRK